ncbi:MAG TPA: L,D-transpeptidase [Gemmatimonadaceae bacterium]|nr:L,D-transpeptidase [Gemmatimonadaceae bacterium]
MMRLSSTSLRLSLLLAAAPFATVAAQAGTPASDSAPLARVDSVQNGRSWLVALLHKIARRSDEVAPADTSAYSDGEVSAEEVARYARPEFHSRKDSLEFEAARAKADRSKGYRIVVDLFAHSLYVIDGDDTLRAAPAATAMNASLTFGKKTWRFETPRGVRKVLSKDEDPSWTPPEWHYAEVALEHHLKLRTLNRGQVVRLQDGTKLLTRGDEVGVIYPGTKEFVPMELDEHVVFDNTLFIPPAGTKQRSIKGELGHYRLALGDGYLLHGTPYANSIGSSVTHGCVRLQDDDIEWLYENVPVGTRVYIY